LAWPEFKAKYDNYIGGKFVPSASGQYFDVVSPINGKVFTQAAHSNKEDLEAAVNAATEAFKTWKDTSPTERSIILNKIADRIEQNLEYIATVETIDNGKAVRETLAADIPLAIDHFRYFASVIRAEEGSHNELDKDTVSLIVHEPLGVIAQIIPWNFPILMAVWKLAPALAAGNCVVLKPQKVHQFLLWFYGTDWRFASGRCCKYCERFRSRIGKSFGNQSKVAKQLSQVLQQLAVW
jgi:aldehyde dehydrogenase